jgi:hypothetical protein
MSVWLCIPSKRPSEQAEPILAKWREMGYKIALVVDTPQEAAAKNHLADAIMSAPEGYRGYARSVNGLVAGIIANAITAHGDDAEWFVAAGDDTLPDPNKRADEIARECSEYFMAMNAETAYIFGEFDVYKTKRVATYGVMQPTGDPWADRQGRIIERIAGSPWLGREWCLRANQRKGPVWPEFFHCWADETLQLVAQQLGVFWQRPDLTHLHNHWARPRGVCPTCKVEGTFQCVEGHRGMYGCPQCGKSFLGERIGQQSNMAGFLERAYSGEQTKLDKAEFDRLKAGGFKECLPL